MADTEFLGGVTNTRLHFEDGNMVVEEIIDAEPILEYTAAARNHRFSADVADGMMRHEAEIPWTVFIDECRKRGLPVSCFGSEIGDRIIDEIIRDPQYAKFRAAPTTRDPRVIMKGLR